MMHGTVTSPTAKPASKSGWPKQLPCLICDADRTSTWAGDRMHDRCKTLEGTRDGINLTKRRKQPGVQDVPVVE
jgi:hypothetical protein